MDSREQIVRHIAKVDVEQRRGTTGKINDTDLNAASAIYNVVIVPLLAEAERKGAEQSLRQAADDWQQGQWADAPRRADRVQERMANAQFVTDWLRARAERARGDGPA